MKDKTNQHLQSVKEPKLHFGLKRKNRVKKLVGVVAPSYGSEKLSYGLHLKDFEYCKLRRIPLQRIKSKSSFWSYSPVILDNSVDLIHTNNHIPLSRSPFVLSFENELPRYLGDTSDWMLNFGYKRLRSLKCRKILGMSEIAAKLAKGSFTELGFPEIAEKVSVFRGGLPINYSNDLDKRDSKGPIKLLFVGRDGFRKGIVPIITAVEELVNNGIEVELTLVSKLAGGEYVFKDLIPDVAEWAKKIEQNNHIKWHRAIANSEVKRLMRESDLLLFPSFDETLGWVIIEAALEGLPSFVTNIFAFPELVEDNKTGAIVNLDLGKQSRWNGVWQKGDELRASIEKANGLIHDKIVEVVTSLDSDRDLSRIWGTNAFDKISAMYNIDGASKQLEEIYRLALMI